MKDKNLFEGKTNERSETIIFTGLGLAGIVTILLSMSSIAHSAAKLDQVFAPAPTPAMPAVEVVVTGARSPQIRSTVPGWVARPQSRSTPFRSVDF